MATAAESVTAKWRRSGDEEAERCIERTASEQECELMLEALCRELGEIKVSLRRLVFHPQI